MPLHPLIQSLLDDARSAGIPRVHQVPVEQARLQVLTGTQALEALGRPAIAVEAVEERSIDGPAGPIPLRIYRAGAGPGPLIVYIHGGGWVICSLDTHDHVARALARETGAVVVSVDYRMAPEHPFPAAPDDCYAALLWAAREAEALGADPARLFVAGDSAGGNLAAVAALDATGAGAPALAGQILFYPVTEHPEAGYASYRDYAEGYGLTDRDMVWFAGHYLADPADGTHPRFAPALASDLDALPPTLVLTAEYDVLRDEAEAYAARLKAAGVPTTFRRFDGVNHGFLGLIGLLPAADEAIAEAGRFVARTAATAPVTS